MRLRPTLATLAVLALASPLLPAAGAAADEGTGSESLQHLKTVTYEAIGPGAANRGTDIEFTTIRGKEYALAGTYQNGLQIVDITEPEDAEVVGVYECGIQQGDVQVFTRGNGEQQRTYIGYTADDGYGVQAGTDCFTEARRFKDKPGADNPGTFIADITNPANPRTVSFVPFAKGSHNHTIHPDGEYLYNSNSDLITSLASGGPSIEIVDIRDFDNPVRLPDLVLPPVPTSLGAESHDITFNEEGTRAYSAALSQTVIINTEDPAKPSVISTTVDPTINVVHQSDPITVTDPVLGERDFLVIEDEVAGALGTGQCPNGGVHVYDITGELEARPVKVGYWNIDDVRTTSDTTLGTCTAHVFDLHEDAAIMTIAYYNGGVRVVDLSGLVGVALGGNGVGMKQVGWRRFDNSDTWAAKTNKIEMTEDGEVAGFVLYGNDQNRGLDLYTYDPSEGTSAETGVWMGAAEAAKVLSARPQVDLSEYVMMCLAGKETQDALPSAAELTAHH